MIGVSERGGFIGQFHCGLCIHVEINFRHGASYAVETKEHLSVPVTH